MKNGKILRCAVYTRKSVSEGLEKDFNTLVAQREAGENYIRSQKHEGWIVVDKHYDDGGFSGGNMERPALRELFDDIENGKIDIVVVYKVDRLSRSLMDFAKIIELFEKHNVSFVSVTQHFNTKDSMGRLTLNILLSFAQFERELISERTRDKMSAARRKGKWVGGVPILGYDISPDGSGLVVNRAEAESVRTIFDTYLDTRSALRTLEILEEKNIRMKSWRTVGGKMHVGKAFTKSTLYYLLKNTAYIGKIRYKGEIYPAEHEAIIDAEVFEKTAERLSSNFRERTTAKVRTKTEGLLSGILYCGHCNRPMTNKYTRKGGNKTYRYYMYAKTPSKKAGKVVRIRRCRPPPSRTLSSGKFPEYRRTKNCLRRLSAISQRASVRNLPIPSQGKARSKRPSPKSVRNLQAVRIPLKRMICGGRKSGIRRHWKSAGNEPKRSGKNVRNRKRS